LLQVATIVCHSNCRADKTYLCLPEWIYEKIQAAGIQLQFDRILGTALPI